MLHIVRHERDPGRRLAAAVFAVGVVILVGAFGFAFIERWTFLDALYMSVITVTTVGLTEVRELDAPGRLFTIFLVLGGVAVFSYSITTLANYLIAGELQGMLGRKRMQKQIDQLRQHYIVCGCRRMGFQVAREFRREKKPMVILDLDQEKVDIAIADGYLALVGDAGDDDMLRMVGVERAKGLVTAMDSDATNLMVVLSARALNESLFIVSRMNADSTESKLITAGANRVLTPYGIGGRRMAQLAVRPNVVEFLEVVTHDEELELWLEDFTVAIDARIAGSALGASSVREETGANILALRQRTGKLMVAPTPETVLQPGDIIVALGTREQLEKLREVSTRP